MEVLMKGKLKYPLPDTIIDKQQTIFYSTSFVMKQPREQKDILYPHSAASSKKETVAYIKYSDKDQGT